MAQVPRGQTIKLHCRDIEVWPAYVKLREGYKKEGMLPREAAIRAYTELDIEAKWKDWRQRRTVATLVGKQGSLTPAETKAVIPSYQKPTVTLNAEYGEESLSFPEVIRWVQEQIARVDNGGESPKRFPNSLCMFWFQKAAQKDALWDKAVLKVDVPSGDVDDLFVRDGQYQFSQIEKQLTEALREVGHHLVELEAGFSETLNELLSVGAEGAGEQSAVPA